MNREFGGFLILVLIAGALAYWFVWKPAGPKDQNAAMVQQHSGMPAGAGPHVGKQAPEVVGTDEDGKPFKLSDYRGKVVLLDFWAEW